MTDRAIFNIEQRRIAPETRLAEFMAWGILLAWTLLLLLPDPLLRTNLIYNAFRHHSANTLAWICGVAVAWLMVGIVTGSPMVRLVALGFAMFVFYDVSLKLWLAAPLWHFIPVNTGVYAYAICAFGCAYGVYKLLPFVPVEVSAKIVRVRLWRAQRAANGLVK